MQLDMNGAINAIQQMPPSILLGLIILTPRILEIARIPMPLSALALGVGWSTYYLGQPSQQPLDIVASVAITMLFLFAGLEVDIRQIRRTWASYLSLSVAHLAVIGVVTAGVMWVLGLEPQTAAILAVGLVTPSAGYILDFVAKTPLSSHEKRAVANSAIGLEVMSLVAMVVILNLDQPRKIVLTAGLIALGFVIIPPVWRALRRSFFPLVGPAEFVSLFMLAMLLSYASKAIGLYYIFGAFMTGMIIGGLNRESVGNEAQRHVNAIEMITALVLPVYFFRAGAHIPLGAITVGSFLAGAAMMVVIAVRTLPVLASQWLMHRESLGNCLKVTMALSPTLVFGLVIAEILTDQPGAPAWLAGALVVHTILITMLPAFVLNTQPAELDVYHDAREIAKLVGDDLP